MTLAAARTSTRRAGLALVFASLVMPWRIAAEPQAPRPEAMRDELFLQETGRKIPSPTPLSAVAVLDSQVFAGGSTGLWRLETDRLSEVPDMRAPIERLAVAGASLWALGRQGVHRYHEGRWTRVSEDSATGVVTHRGDVLLASGTRLLRWTGHNLAPHTTNTAPFAIHRLIAHQESLYLLGGDRLTTFGHGGFGGRDVYGFPSDQTWDWGALPSPVTRDAASVGARLLIATERGLGVLRGMSLTTLAGPQGLPFEDATCVTPGFTNDVWIGTSRGAIRHVGAEFHYFAGERWLPHDRVAAIAADRRTVYIATQGGLGIIDYQPFTLEQKAAYYERHLEAWGQKRLGFVHKLEWDAALGEFVREVSDNDGGYSGDYLAAQAYRFAVTQDPAARAEATNTFHALRWLEAITGIPGFPARSVWAKGERGHKATGGSGGYPAEWHDAAGGVFEWKGDTSSDELCSHYYAVTRFLELAAQGDEIPLAKAHLARIATHLIDHGWRMVDRDGKPTRWGRWDPEYFQTDEGRFDRGLQCVEILSFMKTAARFTGESKFEQAYQELVRLGYPAHTLRQRSTFPPENVLHFEDQLAFWCWWTLLRHETDADLRALYRRGFERSYEVVRIEQNPWYDFLHGALTETTCDVATAIAHLREWPLDLRVWSYQNSHRADLSPPPGKLPLKGGAGTRPFSPREREPMRWDAWTMKTDGGTGGRDVGEPSGWLLAYWMGRYYGFVTPPLASDRQTAAAAPGPTATYGARPYLGPPRP